MVKNNPTLNVFIQTNNLAHLAGKTIQTILNQTYEDLEINIEINGGKKL